MRTEALKIYTFEELSDEAKEAARCWWREGALDYNWWEFVYDDVEQIAKILGIDLDQKPVPLMNGKYRHDPAIYFSGFCSQGDGACFEGQYGYAKGSVKAIKEYAPQDTTLHQIAKDLQIIQKKYFYRLTASTKQSGHYYHANSMRVNVEDSEYYHDDFTEAEDGITEALRDFANWIYQSLENEHDYRLADEQVDESIRINEYEFTEDGTIW